MGGPPAASSPEVALEGSRADLRWQGARMLPPRACVTGGRDWRGSGGAQASPPRHARLEVSGAQLLLASHGMFCRSQVAPASRAPESSPRRSCLHERARPRCDAPLSESSWRSPSPQTQAYDGRRESFGALVDLWVLAGGAPFPQVFCTFGCHPHNWEDYGEAMEQDRAPCGV